MFGREIADDPHTERFGYLTVDQSRNLGIEIRKIHQIISIKDGQKITL